MDLEWNAPPECPDGETVRSEVMQLAGGETSAAHRLKASITIRRIDRSSWILSLATVFDGIAGERTLSAGSCESLAEAAALTLALMLDPNLAPALASAPAHAATPPKPPAAVSANAGTLRPRWRLGAQAGIVAGVLGEASPWFALSLAVAIGHLSLRLIPSATPPQDVFIATEPRVGGRLWAASVSGLGCWGVPIGRLTPNACVGFDGTRLAGHGLGVLHPRDAQVYWNAAELGALVEFRAGRSVLLELGAIGLLPLTRPGFFLEEIGQVSRPAILGIRGFGGLAWAFE